jgi:hypothetical protein
VKAETISDPAEQAALDELRRRYTKSAGVEQILDSCRELSAEAREEVILRLVAELSDEECWSLVSGLLTRLRAERITTGPPRKPRRKDRQ